MDHSTDKTNYVPINSSTFDLKLKIITSQGQGHLQAFIRVISF